MRPHYSLRTYLAIFAILLTVATAALLASLTQKAATQQLQQQIGGSLTQRAQSVADMLERSMTERRQDIELEMHALADRGLRERPSAIRDRLETLRKVSPGYAWIGYADTAGKVIAATDGLLEGANVAQRPWFGGAVDSAFIGDVHGAQLLEKHLNPGGGEPLRFIDVAVPVLDSDGAFVGVLGAHIDWRWIRHSIASASHEDQRIETLILNMADKVLLGPGELQDATLALDSTTLARRGMHGYHIERWPDGQIYLTGYITSRGRQNFSELGWIVLAREKLAHAHMPVFELRRQFLLAGTAIAAFFALVGWYLAIYISRPLTTISNAAQSIQQRDADRAAPGSRSFIPSSESFQEVNVLSDSLSSLVKTLTDREAQLEHQANYQSVTDLPNRAHLTALLGVAIDKANAENRQLAVLVFSLNRFNTITDVLDNVSGNLALREMCRRIEASIDDTCVIGNLDKEEFVIFFDGRDTVLSRAKGQAALLQQVLAKPVHIGGFDFSLTASFGISLYPKHGLHAEKLLRHGEAALQQARVRGGDRVEVYEPEVHARILERLAIERDLRQALERQEFELHYQPQFSFDRNTIVGVEALIRWKHPQRGMVSPALFIPVAEACDLIAPIGDWVLNQACAQARQWRNQGLPDLIMGVNVSAQQLMNGDLVRKVSTAIASHGLEPQQLKLEITESMMMQDVEQGIAVAEKLAALGVKISLDDFGTGYSSLSNLKRFPLNELKIDQSFVRVLAPPMEDTAVIKAIIGLGRLLNLSVIAEGVETKAQLDFLLAAGCNAVQGYHIDRPMPAADFAARMRERL